MATVDATRIVYYHISLAILMSRNIGAWNWAGHDTTIASYTFFCGENYLLFKLLH
jgi:hypothetical protein